MAVRPVLAPPAAVQADPSPSPGDPFSGPRGRALRDEAVAFLRDWLPEQARRTYREMIRHDPGGWHRDPHFAGGIIAEHALRGNGITEVALGVPSLDAVWPELLRRAVLDDQSAPATADARRNGGPPA